MRPFCAGFASTFLGGWLNRADRLPQAGDVSQIVAVEDWWSASDPLAMLQVGIEGRHDHPRINRKQVETADGYTHVCVDDNAFVKDVVQHINVAR
jgi:hypothetical protein